jgi:gliding motility-associated-like protein
MKRISILIILIIFYTNSFGQGGTWTWIHGSNTNGNGVYGTKGVSSPSNVAPGRYHAVYWTDNNGQFWMFGGGLFNQFNDLWKYNPTLNEWTWMHGPQNQNNISAVYGTMGVPSVNNNPENSFLGGFGWVDNNNDLWLFESPQNELWRYHIATDEWTYMKDGLGSTTYGVKGVPNAANNPPAVSENKCAWMDYTKNNLYLYDGKDMWSYDIGTNNWTWLHGTQGVSNTGVYGIKGVASASNIPPSRYIYSYWQDEDNNLYMYGGMSDNFGNYLNDIWKFDIVINQWTWVGGTQAIDYIGDYDSMCAPSANRFPRSRMENRSIYPRCNTYVYNFGGSSNDASAFISGFVHDLWFYDISNNQWTWLTGTNTFDHPGNWGSKGVTAASNMIPGKWGVSLWTDTLNSLYIFAGETAGMGEMSDMWKFVPDTACTHKNLSGKIHLNTISNKSICIGDSVLYKVNGGFTFSYMPNTGVTANVIDTSKLTFAPSTTTTYTIYAKLADRCNDLYDTLIFTINVVPIPNALFDINPPIAAIDTLTGLHLNNQSTTNYSNTWYYNNGIIDTNFNSIYVPTDSGKYCFTLISKNILGCADTFTKCVDVTKVGMSIYMPNAFSPNSDNMNDIFKPLIKNVTSITMKIYNRFGELIFKTSTLNEGWNGKHNEENVDIGTYYYVVTYTGITGKIELLKGDFELLR